MAMNEDVRECRAILLLIPVIRGDYSRHDRNRAVLTNSESVKALTTIRRPRMPHSPFDVLPFSEKDLSWMREVDADGQLR
jgi:hypothetical protein